MLGPDWPHPAEQFKRTAGNDWVYYTVGDKSGDDGIVSWMGEYYLACLPYTSNPVWEIKYFSNPRVMNAMGEWSKALHKIIGGRVSVLPPDTRHVDYDVIPLTIADGCSTTAGSAASNLTGPFNGGQRKISAR